eukprot:65402-Pelagomonas_calceolata.AAC.2
MNSARKIERQHLSVLWRAATENACFKGHISLPCHINAEQVAKEHTRKHRSTQGNAEQVAKEHTKGMGSLAAACSTAGICTLVSQGATCSTAGVSTPMPYVSAGLGGTSLCSHGTAGVCSPMPDIPGAARITAGTCTLMAHAEGGTKGTADTPGTVDKHSKAPSLQQAMAQSPKPLSITRKAS